MGSWRRWTGALALWALGLGAARAEVPEIRVGMQYGLPYIQFAVMQDQRLIEKHAKAAGLGDVKVAWLTLGGPAALNDAVISGALEAVAVGLPNLVTMWAKTRGNIGIRALSGMNAMPLILVSRDPRIRTLDDLRGTDRIAVPSVKISMQAILLQIAAAKRFGDAEWSRLDPLTVSMAHPDAVAALASGANEVASHFSSAPFQYRQLAQPGIHRVLSSYDIIGRHSVSAIVATAKFREQNPKSFGALIAALDEATEWIRRDKRAAAATYVAVTKDKTPPDELAAMMGDPEIEFTRRPMGVAAISGFLHRIGAVRVEAASWKDLYFPEAHGLDGN